MGGAGLDRSYSRSGSLLTTEVDNSPAFLQLHVYFKVPLHGGGRSIISNTFFPQDGVCILGSLGSAKGPGGRSYGCADNAKVPVTPTGCQFPAHTSP